MTTETTSEDPCMEPEPDLDASLSHQLTRKITRPVWIQDFVLDKGSNGLLSNKR